ncbi:hypothetical protein [Algoriphagus sp.]|uniref:hypothetical protein n=1 Tax=Algoriphagus sp. TaxID=1872435 RepID=UPI00262864D6|nr:hypothetical protein [Algoriphagus sp.]
MKVDFIKKEENKIQSHAKSANPNQGHGKSTFQFVDNRPEAVAQRELQYAANNSQHVSQLKAFQSNANHPTEPIQFTGEKRSFTEAFGDDYSHEYEPPKKRRKILGVNRLHRAYLRNRKKKARPSKPRNIFGRQQLHNYGFDNKVINFGSVKGDFYKGPFGGQPYLRINKEDYGLKAKPKSNYDDIVKGLEKFKNDAELAKIIIDKIREGVELPEDMDKNVKANVSLLLQLTHFIEPHDSRVPGIDKLARSFFEEIADGKMTFKQVFNRKDGLFVVARAKSGGATFGGQEAGRTLVGMPAKKSDKSTFDEIWNPDIDRVAEEMSDSSDEE